MGNLKTAPTHLSACSCRTRQALKLKSVVASSVDLATPPNADAEPDQWTEQEVEVWFGLEERCNPYRAAESPGQIILWQGFFPSLDLPGFESSPVYQSPRKGFLDPTITSYPYKMATLLLVCSFQNE